MADYSDLHSGGCAVLALYLWAIRPNTARKETCLAFSRWDFAHRGLWNMERGIPENSLPAFKKAVDHVLP